MNEQLSLFSEKGSEYFRTGAESLLEALNLDRKQKEKYQIEYYYQHKNLFVIIACNAEKKPICNIVDENGKIPNGFSVNWRVHDLVTNELN